MFFPIYILIFILTIITSFFFTNSIINVILFFFLSIVSFLYYKKLFNYSLNPIGSFTSVWFFITGIAFFPWYEINFKFGELIFNSEYLIFYWVGTVSFIIGLYLPMFNFRKISKVKFKTFKYEIEQIKNLKINSKNSHNIYIVSGFIFMISTLSSTVYWLISKNILGVTYLINLNWIAFSLSLMNYLFSKNRKVKFLHPVYTSFMILFLIFIMGKKMPVFYISLNSFYIIILRYKEEIWKILILFLVVILFFISFHFYFRSEQTSTIQRNYIESGLTNIKNPKIAAALIYTSNYIWTNFSIMQKYLDSNNYEFKYGLRSFRFIFQPLFSREKQTKLMGAPRLMEGVAVIFLGDYFFDFGHLGIMFLSCFFGYISSKLYIFMLNSKTIYGIIINSFIFNSLVLLFAKNTFSNFILWFNIIIIVVISFVFKFRFDYS